jgi:hypothetical protein
MSVLGFTAGLLTVAAVEDMISEAHESAEDSRWFIGAFTGGSCFYLRLRGAARIDRKSKLGSAQVLRSRVVPFQSAL